MVEPPEYRQWRAGHRSLHRSRLARGVVPVLLLVLQRRGRLFQRVRSQPASTRDDLAVHQTCTEGAFPAINARLSTWVATGSSIRSTTKRGAIQLGCPPQGYPEWPYLSFAEAGTLCEHDVEGCEWSIDAHCAPRFAVDEFSLAGQSGTTVHGVFPFVTGDGHNYWCEPWAERMTLGWVLASRQARIRGTGISYSRPTSRRWIPGPTRPTFTSRPATWNGAFPRCSSWKLPPGSSRPTRRPASGILPGSSRSTRIPPPDPSN